MFIPIGHDQDTISRLPWVTFTIMILCFLAFVASISPQKQSMARAERLIEEIGEYFFQNPDLQLEPDIEDFLLGFVPEYQDQREAFKEFLKETTSGAGIFSGETDSRPPKEERQQVLDDLTRRFHDAIGSSPYYSWGLVPAHQKAIAYVTYQFMHGGWMHLIFNLLFLYLSGPYIEDVWGRPFFACFYIGAGLVSALAYVLKYPDMEGPLVGASGAIAGVMGAFLIRHARTKIRFMMMILLTVRIIDLPAWIMLPLWVLRELFYGQAVDFAGGEGTGVAHWAHVSGFVFGVVVAVAVRQFGFEKKVEAQFIQYENTKLDEALEAIRDGDKQKAAEILQQRLREAPTDMDSAATYWDVQKDLGDVKPAVQPVLRACREALRDGQGEFVAGRWNDILEHAPKGTVDTMTAVRVGEILGKDLFPEVIVATVAAGLEGATPNTPEMVLARLARVGAKVSSPGTAECARRALESESLPEEVKAELEAIVAEDQAHHPKQAADPWSTGGDSAIEGTVGPVQHTLKIMEAVPETWENQKLTIQVKGSSRNMSMAQVEAIAVAGVAEPGHAPFVVVDLLLDGPWGDREALRVVRLRSNSFDPKALVGGADSQESFRAFLEDILKVSGAVPLPDPDSVRGMPFQRFSSIAAYENQVLGISEDGW